MLCFRRRLFFLFFSATLLILLPSFSLSASLFLRQTALSCAQGNSLSNWGSGRKLRLERNLIERKWTRKERSSVPWHSCLGQRGVCRRRIDRLSPLSSLLDHHYLTDIMAATIIETRHLNRCRHSTESEVTVSLCTLYLSARTGALT